VTDPTSCGHEEPMLYCERCRAAGRFDPVKSLRVALERALRGWSSTVARLDHVRAVVAAAACASPPAPDEENADRSTILALAKILRDTADAEVDLDAGNPGGKPPTDVLRDPAYELIEEGPPHCVVFHKTSGVMWMCSIPFMKTWCRARRSTREVTTYERAL